jgi:hypothetical protein
MPKQKSKCSLDDNAGLNLYIHKVLGLLFWCRHIQYPNKLLDTVKLSPYYPERSFPRLSVQVFKHPSQGPFFIFKFLFKKKLVGGSHNFISETFKGSFTSKRRFSLIVSGPHYWSSNYPPKIFGGYILMYLVTFKI